MTNLALAVPSVDEIVGSVDGFNASAGMKSLSLESNMSSKVDLIFGTATYWGSSNVEEQGFLLTSSQHKIKGFSRGLDSFSVDLHRIFDHSMIERLEQYFKAIEEKRKLSPTEIDAFYFFTTIDDFLSELEVKIGKLKEIDFSRIQTQGYYNPAEGQEEYAQETLQKFKDFQDFVTSSMRHYDFLADTINSEFKLEAPEVTQPRGRFAGMIGKIVGKI